MKILFVIEDMLPSSGWGRYSGGLVSSLRSKGLSVVTSEIDHPLGFRKHFILSWLEALKLYFKHRNTGVSVIHCTVEPYALIAYILSKLLRAKLVVTLHGTYAVKFMPHLLYGPLQRLVYKRAGTIVTVSQYSKQSILKYVSDLDMQVIANGVYRGLLPSVYTDLSSRPKKIILTVAPFKERKGLHILASSMRGVFDRVPESCWIVVGRSTDKIYKDKVLSIITEAGVSDRCVLMENVTDDELHKLYQEATLFALTPISTEFDFEGFGLVYLEANAVGVPTVGVFGSGAEEAISQGRSGFLVDKDHPEVLAKTMIDILSNDDLYKSLSKGALEWSKEHDWAIVAEKYAEIYRKLCK